MDLSTPIQNIPRVGPVYLKKLQRMGIRTIEDLLWHFPHRYEDFSNITPISKIKLNPVRKLRQISKRQSKLLKFSNGVNEKSCVVGKILSIENIRTWKRKMTITEAILEDKTGAIKITWFNQPYLKNTLKQGDNICIAGKVTLGKDGLYFSSPVYEKLSQEEISSQKQTHTGRIIPVYPETEGLSSRWLRWILKFVLYNLKNKIPEILPLKIIKDNNLAPVKEAIWQIHFPDSMKLAEKAKNRFSFEELFLIELSVLKERLKLNQEKAYCVPLNLKLTKEFVDSLTFKLTDAQRKCTWQILKDMEKPMPMSRLLEGDVGSGKTVVAVIAILNTVKAGYQAGFMAPTEILAKQHFGEVSKLLRPFKIKIALLTGKSDKIISLKLTRSTNSGQVPEILEISRNKLLEKTKNGEINVLIGTHALIQDKVKFKKLGLCIIDEQHRFGVEQRANLTQNPRGEKRIIPHLLSMTATPIPRSLALTIYGDLDLSVLDEMPKGRKKITTEIVSPEERNRAYEFIKKQVKKGEQVFVICPRIEANEEKEDSIKSSWSETKAVKQEYEKLSREVFPDLNVEMMHSKIKTREKEKTMKSFKNGKIDILVSTSVVEVGLDIPKATVMMIEGAERFGLAQLHQFRGRVGRSNLQSYCLLFTDSGAKKTRQRLNAILKAKSGFELAQKDLEIRGPGSLHGVKQWGIPDLAMENLKNVSLVEKTREAAKEILSEDPLLKKYPLLQERVKSFKQKIHLE